MDHKPTVETRGDEQAPETPESAETRPVGAATATATAASAAEPSTETETARQGSTENEPARSSRAAKRGAKTKRKARVPRATEPSLRGFLLQTLLFTCVYLALNTVLNLRYPGDEPRLWYLRPSTDILFVLVFHATMAYLRESIPRFVHFGLVFWLVFVRLLRVGDGVQERYFGQRFTLYTDLTLVPEGIRFVYSTRPFLEFVLGALVVLGALAALVYGCYRGLGYIEGFLAERRRLYAGAAVVAISYFASAVVRQPPGYEELFDGKLAASSVPRLKRELDFVLNVRGESSVHAKLIAETQRMLGELPKDLAKLAGVDVHFILVESYGRTMFEWPPHVAASKKTFETFETELTAQGFTLASGVLDSSTYGGRSWLAHATINTGIPTRDQLEYEIMFAKRPKPMATFFREAGYLTVLVSPGTTRESPHGDFYGFERKYAAWDFGYQGPRYGWARMPDQYVLDFVRRKELAHKTRPLFIQYVLVSSHAPWSAFPAIVEDWEAIGDGSIFKRVATRRFPIEWPNFENAGEAYAQSIIYDFELLRRYIARFIRDRSLIIILGDHQPVWEVNGNSMHFGVPLHVLSRNPALVEPFLARGFVKGIRPDLDGFQQGLETLLPSLLVDFSTPKQP